MLLNRKVHPLLTAFCVLLLAFSAVAQSSQLRPVVLKAARLYDGKSDKLVSPGIVIVQGNAIVSISPDAIAPRDATVIELGDATLMPGLIDAHTHLGWAYAASYDQREMERMRKNPPELALDASVWVRKTLMAGFTTVRDLGSSDFIDVGLRNAVADGSIIGPRMLVAVRMARTGESACDDALGVAVVHRVSSHHAPGKGHCSDESVGRGDLGLARSWARDEGVRALGEIIIRSPFPPAR